MSNLSVNRTQVTHQVTTITQTQAAGQPASKPAQPPALNGDNLSLSQIRGEVMNLEARITQFKLMEEERLAGMLNEQLDFLQNVASEQKAALLGNLEAEQAQLSDKLERVSAYRELLPEVVEYQSIEYVHHKQIEAREQGVIQEMNAAEARTMQQINTLEAYVSNVRSRSNAMISKVNGHTLAGSEEMDKRIGALRNFLGELASSPISRNLIAAKFH